MSPLVLKAVGAHMTRVFGEEAAAVRVACMWGRKSNVAVMVCGRATQWIRAYFTSVSTDRAKC